MISNYGEIATIKTEHKGILTPSNSTGLEFKKPQG